MRRQVATWRFNPAGPGVEVPVVDDFAPRVHAQAYRWFRNAHLNPEIRAELRQFLGLVARPGCPCRFLDVGAHFGLFSLAALDARPDASVLALEPSPTAFTILRWHLDRLPAERVVALQVAAGESPGQVSFHQANDRSGMLHCVAQSADQAEVQQVQVVTLDDVCAARQFSPTVIKIDVEGYEGELIRGATRILAEDRPTIVLELHGNFLNERGLTATEVLEPLKAAGYQIEAVAGQTDEQLAALSIGMNRRFLCRPGA